MSILFLLPLLFNSCVETKDLHKNSEVTGAKGRYSTGIPFENVISKENLAQAVKYLSSDELKGRQTGTEGIEKAAEFIEDVFRNNHIKPFFRTYRDSFEVKGMTGYNIVGLKKGTDSRLKDEIMIIGAHYDHIGGANPVGSDSLANGANDNASGTAAVLELMKYFAEVDTKRSILFTFFSAEELGLVGSTKLASKLKNQGLKPYVMINFEMIGVPMPDNDYLAYITGYNRSNLAEVFNRNSNYEVLGLLPGAEDFNLFKRSDNYAFFEEFGIPSHTVSTFDFNNYDYYHHVNDEFVKLNFEHMDRLVEALVPGLRKMANSEEKEIRIIQ